MPVPVEASPLLDGAQCVGAVLVLRVHRAAERSLDFEALAAGLAHEIKNPLAGLQGSAELLAREAEGPAREYATVIAREAKRVDGLVRELLDLARPAALQLSAVAIHDVAQDVLVLAKGVPGGDRVAFVRRYDPSLPPIHADQEKLTQVLLNLVRNALVIGNPIFPALEGSLGGKDITAWYLANRSPVSMAVPVKRSSMVLRKLALQPQSGLVS